MKNDKMRMTSETAAIIHKSYVASVQTASINTVEVEEHLLKLLDNAEIPEKDVEIMDYFMDKLSKSILARKNTFVATNLCTDILHVCMYIVAWLNERYNAEIDVNISARRKSLESELAKMLSLADALSPSQIQDRFGIRFILAEGITKCCFLVTKTVNVLCNLNRRDRKEFLSYLEKFDQYTQYRIRQILEMPINLAEITRKDNPQEFNPEEYPYIELPTPEDWEIVKHLSGNMKYYFLPKKNGYQSIHCLLTVNGLTIEIQFRTWAMDCHAENSINASHDVHKDKVKLYAQIFTLLDEDLENTNIHFFNSYANVENDKDGIHFAKKFYDRRMNNISL